MKRTYEDERPPDERHRSREVHLQWWPWQLQRSTEMTAHEKRYRMNCMQLVPKPPCRTLGPAEVTKLCTRHGSGRPGLALRNRSMGEAHDIHTIWYRVTNIMSWEPGDMGIVKVINVVANHRGSHHIVNMNTQLGQPEWRGVSRVLLSAAKLMICALAKSLLRLSIYG